jgi:hypothetical protein
MLAIISHLLHRLCDQLSMHQLQKDAAKQTHAFAHHSSQPEPAVVLIPAPSSAHAQHST